MAAEAIAAKVRGRRSEEQGSLYIEHDELAELSLVSGTPIYKLVKGTAIYVEPARPRPRNAEHEARMAEIRLRLEEQEYRRMVGMSSHEVDQSLFGAGLGREEAKELRSHLSMIANVVLSVLGVAAALWYWARAWPVSHRVLLSFLAAVLTAVAEVGIYTIHMMRLSAKKDKDSKHIPPRNEKPASKDTKQS